MSFFWEEFAAVFEGFWTLYFSIEPTISWESKRRGRKYGGYSLLMMLGWIAAALDSIAWYAMGRGWFLGEL